VRETSWKILQGLLGAGMQAARSGQSSVSRLQAAARTDVAKPDTQLRPVHAARKTSSSGNGKQEKKERRAAPRDALQEPAPSVVALDPLGTAQAAVPALPTVPPLADNLVPAAVADIFRSVSSGSAISSVAPSQGANEVESPLGFSEQEELMMDAILGM